MVRHVTRHLASQAIEQAVGTNGINGPDNPGLARISSSSARTQTEAAALVLLAGSSDPAGTITCRALGLAFHCTFAQVVAILTAND